MDELIALQQELANVQSAKAGFKLSEPNVVEVVQKMVEMGLLEVLYTSNGKEYVTPKRLHEEVADEILAHGGRINITELPPILNVDLPHIERAVDQLLKKDGGLQLYQGDILASYYLDSLAEDVHQALQAAGRVTIGDLAMQYNFSSEFMSKLVEPRLGTLIHAKLSGNALYTSAYTDRHAARVRGVLSALTRPASLPQLVREHAFSEARRLPRPEPDPHPHPNPNPSPHPHPHPNPNPSPHPHHNPSPSPNPNPNPNQALFHETVAELHASGRLPGTLQGKTTYTPALHMRAQQASIGSFYEQNGVIEYVALTKLQVKNPHP